ncbi:MAG: RagB/SusD family nutrient uptake outer membrane protein [Chitinophagaceae bacterium BSSC1]|nr:MAG: RagB/SusD family nutrient uptake outer membrane protein [Chitinophagaceae bacterium BSSC1]
MKNVKYILFVMLIFLASTSCKKTLELAPEDYFGDGNFWQNESQVTNFMVGMHKQFRDNQFMFLRLGEMRSGNYSNIDRQNTSLNELPIIEQRIDENSAGVGSWAGFYNPILQINLFIQKVEASTFLSDAKKTYMLGQAYGMRAYYYFHLLRTYGGVPLRLEPEVLNGNTDPVALRKKRATEAEVLESIKNDVNKSITLFGSASGSTDKSLWSPKASLMLKGELYLWSAKVYANTADLTEAKNALNAVTGNALQPSFANAFAFAQKNNNEIIFSIRYLVGESEMGGVSQYLYSTFNFDNLHYKDSLASGSLLVDPLLIAATNSQQIIQRYGYTFALFQSYAVTDKRRDATFYDYYRVTKSGTPPYAISIRNTAMVKFLGTISANKRYFSDDWPVYREADRLLMLAEIANAEGSSPASFIQLIRNRAFAPAADPTPFVNGTKDANELAIFAERNKEFVFEGKSWYDLRRMKFGSDPLVYKATGNPYGVLDKATQGYKILWPIEPAIWTNDPLVDQTPGYPTAKPK